MLENKDLRDLNEVEFKEVYEYLKKETNDFSYLDKSIIDKNPQYMIIIRLALGLSQVEFSNKLLNTTNKQWIRHFEAKRQGFKDSTKLIKIIKLINSYFYKHKVIDYKSIISLWKKSKAARSKFFLKEIEPKYKIKKVSLMNIQDFEAYFNHLRNETDNFTNFDYNILMETPQFISIFRIILNISTRELGRLFNQNSRTIRIHEYAEYKLMPETANKYMVMFDKLFLEKKLTGNVNYNLVIENFKRISGYDKLEESIIKSLNLRNLDFKLHHNVKINEKNFNFDFFIFKNNEPCMAIESTKIFSNNKESTSRGRTTMKIAYLDHRFQHLKKIYPKIKTVIFIKTFKEQEELAKRLAKREVLNTDFCLINEDISKIL